jgi:hypothetical protein
VNEWVYLCWEGGGRRRRTGVAVRNISCAYLHKEARKRFALLDRGEVLVHPPAPLKKDFDLAATHQA